MKKLAVLATLVWCGAIAAVAAQRSFTNPNRDSYLKILFPAAVAFSPLGGDPPHIKAFGVDPHRAPGAPPIGVAWWTADLDPQEVGYHGPIKMIVGMNMSGTLTGVIVDYDTEPYGYFSVDLPEFAAQFKGKSFGDPFRVGSDVDAVSRASITIHSATRAIRDTSRMVARLLLPPGTVKGDPGGR